jgi:hypothetical protein
MSISKPTDGMGVFCTRCNSEMDADATFCPVCGEPRLLADTVVTRNEPTRVIEETVIDEPAPVVVEDRAIPPWLAATLGILATLVIVLLIVVFAQSNDDEKADTTTTVPTTVPLTVATVPSPSIVTVPVPVVVTPPPTAPPQTAPPQTAPPPTAATTVP